MDVAVIGLGSMGREWVKALSRHPRAQLVALIDPLIGTDDEPDWARQIEGVRLAASLGGINRDLLDAVVIAASTPAHADLVERALKAGLHVLVEKPLATDVDAAAHLVTVASRLRLTLMVNQNFRFHPGPQIIRDITASGEYGNVRAANARFWIDWPGKPYQLQMEHPMLLEMAIHHFDLARAMFNANASVGFVREWNSTRSLYLAGGAVEAFFRMKATHGLFPFLYSGSLISSAPPTPWLGLWKIEYDEATLFIREEKGELGVFRAERDGYERLGPATDSGNNLTTVWDHFASCVAEGREPWCSGRDNLDTLRMALEF